MNTFIEQTNMMASSRKHALLDKSIFRTTSASERVTISNSSTYICSSSRSLQYLDAHWLIHFMAVEILADLLQE